MAKANNKKKDTHTISMLVANKPGVLVRVALVFARRGYNIDALVVSPTVDPRFSRMTITAKGDPDTLEQIIKQASKLVDMIHAEEHSEVDAIHQELALLKLKTSSVNKTAIAKLAKKFHIRIVNENNEAIIIGQTGTTDQLDNLERLLKKHGIIEMVRSGKIVMAKGREKT